MLCGVGHLHHLFGHASLTDVNGTGATAALLLRGANRHAGSGYLGLRRTVAAIRVTVPPRGTVTVAMVSITA